MIKPTVWSLRASLSVSLVVGAIFSPAMARQGPDLGGIVGAILDNALAQQERQQWQNLPRPERDCLAAHNTSPAILAYHGIGLDDPRVQKLFAKCAQDAASSPNVIATPAYSAPAVSNNPDFKVAGLAVGGVVLPNSAAYRAYTCHASEDYAGFQWCGTHRSVRAVAHPYEETLTIFHSEAYVAAFVMQDITPAFFAPGDAETEIQRISQHLRLPSRVMTGEARADAPHSTIATWGDVTLIPLDDDNVNALRNGQTIHAGIIMDFLGDAKRSANQGMPLYRIGGGAGYIWNAVYDESGRGRLRIIAVNTDLIYGADTNPGVTKYAPSPELTPAPTVTPTAAPNPEKLEADRAARAERAIAAAKTQIEDAEAFIKEHPQSPQLLDYIERLSALAEAVKTSDPDAIERKSTDLSASLGHDRDYQRHLVDLAEIQKRRTAQYLIDAVRLGEAQRAFIMDFIAKNPLDSATPSLTPLVKQVTPLLQKNDLASLQATVDKIALTIREFNLQDKFLAVQKGLSNGSSKALDAQSIPTPSPNSTSAPTTISEQLPATEKNRFLIEGDLADVEILYNSSASAPHIAQNLRGDFVFTDNTASVCMFGQNPDSFMLSIKKALSAAISSKNVKIAISATCDPDQLATYDLVATQRGAFLHSPRDAALSLVKLVEADDYKIFSTITAADINRSIEAERSRIGAIKANVADGAPEGYGIVLLKTGSSNLCVAITDKMESHRELLLRAEEKISLDMQLDVVLKNMNVEDAFIAAQKRQCGAIYGSAADLKTVTAALTRNSVAFSFSTLWLLPKDIDEEDAAIAQERRNAAQKATERAQRNADQANLASARAKDLNATQAAQEAALRAKFGNIAKAAAATLSSEIIGWSQNPQESKTISYPLYLTWLANKFADHWEIMKIDSELRDFGTSNLKGRSVDTIFSTITVHIKNRILAEYNVECFVFGRINDTEFGVTREFFNAPCDDNAALSTWQMGHQFKSEWVVSN